MPGPFPLVWAVFAAVLVLGLWLSIDTDDGEDGL